MSGKFNDNYYLSEAFQKLSLLENDFDFTNQDIGVVDELKSFVADDIDAPVEERIIDTDAEVADDLQDTYVGKVILECDCCHARIYKNKDDVIVDEETNLANVAEKCPVCNGEFGYKVIGKIEAFDGDAFREDEKEVVNLDAEAEDAKVEDDFDESFKSALTEALAELTEDDETSNLDNLSLEEMIDYIVEAYYNDPTSVLDEILRTDCADKVIPELFDTIKENVLYQHDLSDDALDGIDTEEMASYIAEIYEDDARSILDEILNTECAKDIIPELFEEIRYTIDEGMKNVAIDSKRDKDIEDAIDSMSDEDAKELEKHSAKAESLESSDKACDDDKKLDEEKEICPECGDVIDDEHPMCDKCKEKAAEKEEVEEACKESLANSDVACEDDKRLDEEKECDGCEDKEDCKEEKCDEACNEEVVEEVAEPLTEAIDEVEVKTKDGEIEVEKEGNKVSVEFKDDEEEVPASEDEMIAPLNDEEVAEIEANEPEAEDDVGLDIESEDEEVPAEGEEENEEDIDFDEFDDDAFADMGESYMKRVYGNVKSFIVENASKDNKQLVVEGKVQFESGKEKATKFVFENARLTKRGKVVLEGCNEMFSKSPKAFRLKGTIVDNKFLGEGLIYDYTASQINESNESESVRVHGRIVR